MVTSLAGFIDRMPRRPPHASLPKVEQGQYRLKRFTWRSLLTFIGPLSVVAFYSYIAFSMLVRPPQNGIVPTVGANARAIFYVWFILSVFALDWSRTGLANIEAAALMHPHLAPATATQLMWHTDAKWANPLWWARAIWYPIVQAYQSRQHPLIGSNIPAGPGRLWVFLSCTHLLLFVSLPLSGLSMEFSAVQKYTRDLAQIFGPNATTFNERSRLDLPHQIRSFWQSGRPTNPRNGSVIYAPRGNKAASSSYYDEQAAAHADSIESFIGPVVHEAVYGRTWGLSSNITCAPVSKDQLQTLQIHGIGDLNFSVNACIMGEIEPYCQLSWHANTSEIDSRSSASLITIPTWLNESGASDGLTIYTIMAAADGSYATVESPYTNDNNHDGNTFDSMVHDRPQNEVTTAIFEIFLWQQHFYDDEVMQQLINGTIKDPVEIVEYMGQYYAGIAVHCDVTSAVGYADLDPTTSTFSSFSRSSARHKDQVPLRQPGQSDLRPPQILALQALARERSSQEPVGPLKPYNKDCSGCFSRQTWVSLHDAINSLPILNAATSSNWRSYHSLTPKDLQLAVYKLLGESMIAMMDEGGVEPSYDSLYSLSYVTYLVSGVVSWIYVLTLLSLWAFVMSTGALWMLLMSGRRWAKTLDGLEMFKFGAQLAEEVNELESTELKGCRNALKSVPGMVGMLSGDGAGAATSNDGLGFIGLSENVASQNALYTLDRRQASRVRSIH